MVHVISVPEHETIANVLVGVRPREATFTGDGRYAFVTAEISGDVSRLDMRSLTIDRTASFKGELAQAKPKGILLSRDEKTLYVATGRAAKIAVLDAETLSMRSSIKVGARVWGLALSTDGTRLYTTNGGDDTVSVIDTERNEVIATISVGKAPWGAVVVVD